MPLSFPVGFTIDSSLLRTRAMRRISWLVLLAVTYFAAGELGLQLAYFNQSASPVWPAAGIALGVLLCFGTDLWPAVALGALLVNVTATQNVTSSVLIAAGNTLEGLVGCWLVTRFAGGLAAFERASTAFRFSLLAGGVASAIAASMGTFALLLTDLAKWEDVRTVWLTWWLGDGVGVVLVAPAIIMWTRPMRRPWTPRRSIEMLSAVLVVSAVTWIALEHPPSSERPYPLALLAMPILLAFRLGARETASAMILLSIVAVAATVEGLGPFATDPLSDSLSDALLFLQSFIGVWSVAILAVAIEVETRQIAEAEVRALNDGLEQRVTARTEELSRVRDRLAEAQRVASIGSWEWDIAANTIWWSDELFRLFRVPRSERRTYEQYLDLLPPDERTRVSSIVGKAVADGRPFSFEHRLVWPDGSVRTIHSEGHVIVDADGRPLRLVGTGHDITDRRMAEDERLRRLSEQAARVEAEDISRAKDEFLATLSHELRTPLNAAMGWSQMLRGDLLNDPVLRRRATEAIMRNLQAQARLVSDMMDVSAIALRTLRLETTFVVMQDVVRGAIDSVRNPAIAQRISVDAHVPSLPIHVVGDPVRLQQVVWNLVSNAAKFTRDGGTVTVTLTREGHVVRLTVRDEGPGIDPAFLPHLFERFSQADTSATREHGGLGLGLAIARHLVEAHEGTISAANCAGGGAIFTVELPAASEPREGVVDDRPRATTAH